MLETYTHLNGYSCTIAQRIVRRTSEAMIEFPAELYRFLAASFVKIDSLYAQDGLIHHEHYTTRSILPALPPAVRRASPSHTRSKQSAAASNATTSHGLPRRP